jgi:hypothetical protein
MDIICAVLNLKMASHTYFFVLSVIHRMYENPGNDLKFVGELHMESYKCS